MNIPKPTSSAGNAPEIEDDIYVADFTGIEPEDHPDWAQQRDKYGKVDTGQRFRWYFTVLDEDGNPAVPSNAESPDDLLVVDALTRNLSNHEKSSASLLMRGLTTPAEFKLWEAGDNEALVAAFGGARRVRIKVAHSDKGYPQVEATLGPVKAKK